MAELNVNINGVNQINQASINNTSAQRTTATPAVQPSRENVGGQQERVRPGEEQTNIAPAYENIVSVSEDGDTVQASPESMQELEDDAFGTVVERNEVNSEDNEPENSTDAARRREAEDPNAYDPIEAQRKEAERRAEIRENIELERRREEIEAEAAQNAPVRVEARNEEREELQSPQITSFAGYTDTQLRSLYLSGEITRADYDAEMENREELKQETIEDIESGNEQLSREMSTYAGLQEQNNLDNIELQEAYSPDANDNIAAADRVEIISQLQQQNQTQRQLQDISITT